jgi:hypothetical protein
MKTCYKCGTQIPFIASVCPNCTRDIGGSSDGTDAGAAVMAFIIILTVAGISNCVSCLTGK